MVSNKTPISLLQEFLMQKNEAMPSYRDCASDSPDFTFKCESKVKDIIGIGYGLTKKEAKQNAAKELLCKLGIKTFINKNEKGSDKKNIINQNYIGVLNNYASCNNFPYPTYFTEINNDLSFKTKCNFLHFTTEGLGSDKKKSKQIAAKEMMNRLSNNGTEQKKIEDEQKEFIKNIEKNISQALLKYELKIKELNKGHNEPTSQALESTEVDPKISNICTIDDLTKALKNLGLNPFVGVFQKQKPYIITLRFKNNDAAVMSIGNTLEEANEELLAQCKKMLARGFDFKNPPL